MLLHRPTGVRTLPKPEWHARITAFQAGEWLALLRAAQDSTTNNSTPTEEAPTAQQQARRARQLVHQGELSAARQALTAGPLAPHTEATLQELRDPARRPAQPYQPIPEHVLQFQPASPTNLPAATLLANVRRARKGTAPGPSGLTAETLRLILDEESITNNFVAVATRLAQAKIPPAISAALGLGRLVALSKPNGRVRGVVVGDLLRRVVARSLAQHHAHTFQQACSPHQYALSTRAGSEAVVHAITSLTELEPTSTILSIDGIGAYDTIARASMLQALAEVEGANTCLPFVRQFYATTSTYIWHDHSGQPHEVLQAEGGEQGDPLMPALFPLGQRAALQTAHSNLQPGETLFAFLDDEYVVLPPHRVRPVYDLLQHHLFHQARIQLNAGKTRVWNQANQTPPNIQTLGPEVWVGGNETPPHEQGLLVLRAPVGSDAYKLQQLQHTRDHNFLLQRLPDLEDLQAAWLLLLFCASPRCHYHLRMLPPNITAAFSTGHDTAVAACLTDLLDTAPMPATSLAIAHLPLNQGGLGLASATILAPSA